MKTGQIYKDKATLIDVMTKYKIKNNFNCKVRRSDQQRYDSVGNCIYLHADKIST